ncbi:MAG: hypothetical protein GXC73_11955 [Chitinophagaceae bacterium]|nr:hypothetical protein [Chitinophagaceae bacterium]
MRYLLFLIFLTACQNNSPKEKIVMDDSPMAENERLRNALKDTKKSDESLSSDATKNSKFCYILLTYVNREMGDGLEGLKDVQYLTWSDIFEVTELSEEKKFRLMDEFEKKFQTQLPAYFKAITKREVFEFDTYVEASKHLASKKGL